MDKKLLTVLQRQCARREYCSDDIYKKALKALDGDVDGAQEIVSSLCGEGFVDDLRYATAFAREKASLTGWGPVKIKFALSAKKIDRATIAGALAEIDPEASRDKLGRLLAAKKKSLEGDPQIKLKLIRFALSRGYDYDEVASVIDTL